ncbi:LOG family protein [Chlorobaculum sp. MV4-Y]|uniref:LOG family protein n=1 Tax=Chlorobaculum sp. MV4-Y TaxID=2976335 RepID=UPI0021B0759D|nr:LOG family protein [Chlorobaculum sp. MV4-Y]UWX58044.1 LOG family protein [Chlorobaculum sp. MV4-Y]
MEPHYRVTIFGSARISEGDKEYRDVYEIARGLAAEGFDIVTGGGPGLMQAANSGSKSVSNGGQSIGLNIKLPHEQAPNPWLDIKEEFDRFSGRLDAFMAMSDAVIVAPGGIGTLLELFYSWQLVQVQHLCETPIILFGEIWTSLLLWLETEVLPRHLFERKDMHSIFHVMEASAVVDLIIKIHKARSETEHVCRNFNKYRLAIAKKE